MTKGLLLSAYAAGSHQRWRRGLQHHLPTVEWTILELPPRFFSWRIRGNAMVWAVKNRSELEAEYDFLLATSMSDVATLKGLVPKLQSLPTIVYFHENQFVYPVQHEIVQREVFHFCMANLYTAMAADVILFNSQYNRHSFLEGVTSLLKKMPDYAPKSLIPILEERSTVLPVPLEDSLFEPRSPTSNSQLTILWNHRWEYDKAPERFFAALFALKERGLDFSLHIVGQRFRQAPSIFEHAKVHLADHITTWGYLKDRSAYLDCLRRSDVVVSTAVHEFQGLSILEAMACGCIPLAPNRLVYPELLPTQCLYPSFPNDRAKEQLALVEAIQSLLDGPLPSVSTPTHLRWSELAAQYRAVIDRVTN